MQGTPAEAARSDNPWGMPLASVLIFLFFGLCSLLITPPLQVPDGPAHYYRAYQISELRFIGEKRGQDSGGDLPGAVAADGSLWTDLPFHANRKISLGTWAVRLRLSRLLDEPAIRDRHWAPFANTVMYSPIPYLPQAVMIALSRWMELPDMLSIYASGFGSLIVCTLLFLLALRALDFAWRARNIVVLVMGTPMTICLAASTSADGVVLALASLDVALALRLRFRGGSRTFALFIATAVLLSFGKGLYFIVPLGCIPIALPGFSFRLRESRRRAALMLASSLVPMLLWMFCVRNLYSVLNGEPGIDPGRQLEFVLHHPLRVLWIFSRQISIDAVSFAEQAVGSLGWLDASLPLLVLDAYVVALLTVPLFGDQGERREGRLGTATSLLALGACCAFVLAMYLFEYLSWMPVGVAHVFGLQGRHFLPLATLFLVIIPQVFQLGRKARELGTGLVFTGWIATSICMVATLVHRYWSFSSSVTT